MTDGYVDPFALRSEDPTSFPRLLRAGARLRPAYYDAYRNYWVILRHRDVKESMKDTATFSSRFYERGPVAGGFLAKDGAEHMKGRRMFTRAFNIAIKRAEVDVVRPAALDLVNEIADKPRSDLVQDFCLKLPMRVIGELVGVGLAFMYDFIDLVPAMIRWTMWPDDEQARIEGLRARETVKAKLRPVVERELRDPSSSLIGGIIRSMQEDGEYNEELVMMISVGLLLGGYETTASMLAGALTALLCHPKVMAEVSWDPGLLVPAIEESMRWFPSAIGVPRVVMRDVTLDGVTIPAGSNVLLCSASAHYDETVYPDPEIYDIRRRSQEKEMLFGGGPHYCLGAPLARMEARVGLGLLLSRLPGLRFCPDAPPMFSCSARGTVAYSPEKLIVEHDAALAVAA